MKIIKLIGFMLLIIASFALYSLFAPNSTKPNKETVKSTFRSPIGPPPLSIITDKKIYNFGEQVNISVLKGNDPLLNFSDCEITFTRSENRSIEEIIGVNLKKINIESDESPECKDYRNQFVFSLEYISVKDFVWDQLSCEDSSTPIPAIPDDYYIGIACKFENIKNNGPSGLGNTTNIRIGEPQSCGNKKIDIVRSEYDMKNKLELAIKNIGSSDINSVKVYLDKCDDKRQIEFEMEIGQIGIGETKKEAIEKELGCKYASVNAHIDECYDQNPDSWATNTITKL
jgi:hypothetical protein